MSDGMNMQQMGGLARGRELRIESTRRRINDYITRISEYAATLDQESKADLLSRIVESINGAQRPDVRRCAYCDKELPNRNGSGRKAFYCSGSCRAMASRRRRENEISDMVNDILKPAPGPDRVSLAEMRRVYRETGRFPEPVRVEPEQRKAPAPEPREKMTQREAAYIASRAAAIAKRKQAESRRLQNAVDQIVEQAPLLTQSQRIVLSSLLDPGRTE